jgi:uncharacterized protein YegL
MTGFDDIIITKEDEGGKTKTTEKSVHVAFVMDHSGSMMTQQQLALNNYNEQIETLKRKSNESGIETYVTLIEFDDRINVSFEEELINNIKEPAKSYWAGGMTSLNDAIFKGITLLKKGMKKDKLEDKSALLIIMTDGQENSSKEFGGFKGTELLKKEIERLEKTDLWSFTFMGAGIDVQNIAVAGLGMSVGNTMSFSNNDVGYKMSNISSNEGIDVYYTARNNGETAVKNFHENTTAGTEGQKIASSTAKEGGRR